jgi:peptidoglycan LD-endopeptidase LytH
MSVRMRRIRMLTVIAVALAAVMPLQAAASSIDDAAVEAARAISAARQRANEAADRLLAAYSAYEVLEDTHERLRGELAVLEVQVETLRQNVESIAVSRFVASGSGGIPVLTDFRSPNDRVQADVLVSIIADSGATTLDDYAAARRALEQKQFEVEQIQAESLALQQQLSTFQAEAEAEVQRLREVERKRLEDEAVRRAFEAREREERRQLDEIQRRQAEAAQRANPSPGLGAPTAAQLLSGSTGPRTAGASGGAVGGRTGGGGGGSNPAVLGIPGYIDAIICPVEGLSAYGDTWGAPRSGGRRHQGVDMLAPTGTPVVAVVSGDIVHRTNALGGLTVTLLGDNGNRYYYAHLSGYEGLPRRAEQGEAIGYLGDSGNAVGIPHLHFEIRPSNGVPVNPTPSVRRAGC